LMKNIRTSLSNESNYLKKIIKTPQIK